MESSNVNLLTRLRAAAGGMAFWRNLSEKQKATWAERGYLILRRHFSKRQVARINRLVDDCWDKRFMPDPPVAVDVFVGTPGERRLGFSNAPREARKERYKLNDLFLVSDVVRSVVLEDRLVRVLSQLIEDTPLVCNTLNLEYGSGQEFHTDTLYMPAPSGVSGQPHTTRMIATWIALERCTLDAGPLAYYVGSHKIPPYRFHHGGTQAANAEGEMPRYTDYMKGQVQQQGLRMEKLEAEPGDVLIWHEQLFHGGFPIESPGKTRKSIVTHYWPASDVPPEKRRPWRQGFYLDRLPAAPR